MKIALCTYSATGNTRRLAEACREEFERSGHRVGTIDMLEGLRTEPPALDRYDLVGLAMPVMMFRPPLVGRRFLQGLAPVEKPTPAFLLLSCSGMPANSAHTLRGLAARKGLDVRWARTVTCEDSYIPFRRWLGTWIGRGKPDAWSFAKVRDFVARIQEGVRHDERQAIRFKPWSVVHYVTRKAPEEGAKMFLGPRELQDEACILCGRCAEECPTEAISIGDLPVCDEERCIGCCACFNNCPTEAWRLRRFPPRYYYHGRDELPG